MSRMVRIPLGLALIFTAAAIQAASARPANNAEVNYRPIIGIMTQPVQEEAQLSSSNATTASYVSASYVKFLESAGARVSIFHYDDDIATLKARLANINGFLFPGGGASLAATSPFFLAEKAVYDEAIAANDAGDYFPLWGTCLGFEFLSIATSGKHLLVDVNIANTSLPLNFTDVAADSRLFATADPAIMTSLASEAIAYNNHVYALSVESFKADTALSEFYDILSTNVAPNGIEFVSTMESKKYPIYGVQWHPEKPQFEWSPVKNFDHSLAAIDAVEHLADFFVNEARKSHRRFPTIKEETEALVYTDAAHLKYTLDDAALNDYVQCYVFE
eukprot:Opistho-2@54269